MSERAKKLARSFTAFNDEVIAFVENCPAEVWQKVCPGEGWPVSVAAHHIGAGHYGAFGLAKMIVAGEKLPELTADAIDRMNAKNAEEHADATKEEVLGILRKNGSSVETFLDALDDADLDRTGFMAIAGGNISTQQFVEYVIIKEGGQHLSNMKSLA